jgi:hypothetical protein
MVMGDMVVQHVIPSLKAADMADQVAAVTAAAKKVADGLHAIHNADDTAAKATMARALRLETMIEARKVIDAAEAKCPENLWTLATYKVRNGPPARSALPCRLTHRAPLCLVLTRSPASASLPAFRSCCSSTRTPCPTALATSKRWWKLATRQRPRLDAPFFPEHII